MNASLFAPEGSDREAVTSKQQSWSRWMFPGVQLRGGTRGPLETSPILQHGIEQMANNRHGHSQDLPPDPQGVVRPHVLRIQII